MPISNLKFKAGDTDNNSKLSLQELEKKDLIKKLDDKFTQQGGNKSTQQGGNKSIDDYLKKLDDFYNIYNSEIFLKLFGLLSDKELFSEFYNKVFLNNKPDAAALLTYVEFFFIDINNYPDLKKTLKLQSKIPRDTYIYNLYDSNNKKDKIFTYTVVHLIKELINNTKNHSIVFYTNIETSDEITKIMQILFNKINVINDQYDKLKTQKSYLSELYNKLIIKKRKVFAFVKARNDTPATINPRYNYKIINNQENFTNKNGETFRNKYLSLRYYNVDGRYGYDEKGEYTNKQAKSDLLNAIKIFGNDDKDKLGNKKDRKEYYFFGPFDGFYDSKMKNSTIASESSVLILDKLIGQDQDMCVIGYGQSGSGKTSTLIYFNKNKEDGILIEVCKIPRFIETFNRIELKMVNLYVYHGTGVNDMARIQENDYKYNLMEIAGDTNPTFIYDKNRKTWMYEKDLKDNSIPDDKKKGLGLFIDRAFAEREVEPTPNNPNSSRSHVVVCLTLNKSNGDGIRKLVVCDLAGVENVFNCENNEEILKFDDRYKISDMYNVNGGPKEIKFDRYFCDQPKVATVQIKDQKLIDEYNDNTNETIKHNKMLVAHTKQITEIKKKVPSKNKTGGVSKKSTSSEKKPVIISEQGCVESKDLLECPKELKHIIEHKGDIQEILKKISELNKEVLSELETLNLLIGIKNNTGSDGFKKYFRPLKTDPPSNAVKNAVTNIENIFKLGSDVNKMFSIYNKITSAEVDAQVLIQFDKTQKKYDEVKEWCCEYERFKKLQYNCKLRRNEGYMINASLRDMRTDIQMLIKKSLSLSPDNKDFLPLFYEKEIFPYCRNININDEYFNEFYNFDSSSELSGILLKIMSGTNDDREFGLDMSTINFVIFTVINLTDTGKVNNPPNPPFININNLIYYSKIMYDYEKLKEKITNLIEETKQYQFYLNSNIMKELFKQEQFLDEYNKDEMISYANSIIEMVQANNPSTLIGSLVSTDILLNTVYNKLVCSTNSDLEFLLTKFKNEKLDSYITEKYDIAEIKEIIDDPKKEF